MDENIIETTEEAVAESPKKKKTVKALIVVFSSLTALAVVAAILLSTVFAPYGHYLSARWNILVKNYEAAYSHLDKMNKPVLDSKELMLGFIVKPTKATFTGADGNPFHMEEFEYDKNGRLIMEKQSYADGSFMETYDYDDKGNLIEKTFYVNGDKKSYSIIREYDKHNNVTSYRVVYGEDNCVLEIALDYIYENKYPVSADMKIINGKENKEYKAELTFSHDKKGYLTEIVYKGEHTVLDYTKSVVDCETVFTFEYDKDYFLNKLNITEEFSYISKYSNEKHTQKYERCETFNKTDPLRLDWKKTSNGYVSTGWKEWEYDDRGNLIREESFDRVEGAHDITTYDYDKKGHLIYKNKNDQNIEEYTNDKEGNPIEIKHDKSSENEIYYDKKEYEYDKYGNILKATTKSEKDGHSTVAEYEGWQIIYKPIDKRNVFELYDLYSFINFVKF